MSGSDRTMIVTGKTLYTATIAAAANGLSIPLTSATTALGPRLKALGDVYEEFRFRKIVIKLNPGENAAGTARASYAVAYEKDPTATFPTTLQTVYESTASRYSDLADTVPQTLALTRSVLSNGLRTWYSCNSTGVTAADYQQGLLLFYVQGVAGLSANLEIGYEVEFRGATNPTED